MPFLGLLDNIAVHCWIIWLIFRREGLYLTDVTFCREGNPSYRESPHAPGKRLFNFNKYHKLARIVQGQFNVTRYAFVYIVSQICNASKCHTILRRYLKCRNIWTSRSARQSTTEIFRIFTVEGPLIYPSYLEGHWVDITVCVSLLIEPKQPADVSCS